MLLRLLGFLLIVEPTLFREIARGRWRRIIGLVKVNLIVVEILQLSQSALTSRHARMQA